MDTTYQSWKPAERAGVVDCGNGMPGFDGSSCGLQEPKLMDNLYSILTLSLIFYERITRPFENQNEESIFSAAPEPGIRS